jgi:polyphosphate kinase
MLTADEDIAEDATNLFNLLTGICRFQTPRKLLISPWQLLPRMLALIAREAENAQKKRASQAGVRIELIVRGVCCLRPGIPGVSENITVRSIVGRFLEHARIFYFENGGKPEVFLGSADWMSRNLFRRVEVVFPVIDSTLRDRVVNEILAAQLADNTKAWLLRSDGTYVPALRPEGEPKRDAQAEFIAQAVGDTKVGRKKSRIQRHSRLLKARQQR